MSEPKPILKSWPQLKKALRKFIGILLAGPSVLLCRWWPSHFNLSLMRKANNILLGPEQLKVIGTVVKSKAPCKLLVFGLGNDSLFWSLLNRGGITIFLEDDEAWFSKITQRSKVIKAFLVRYDTEIKDWKTYLENPSLLQMTLPDDVAKEKWDIILVDAPAGWCNETPGRMKSIFLSSKLAGHSGNVFVHDCNREVEDTYCRTFLKQENLKLEVDGPTGLLRYYRMKHTPPGGLPAPSPTAR